MLGRAASRLRGLRGAATSAASAAPPPPSQALSTSAPSAPPPAHPAAHALPLSVQAVMGARGPGGRHSVSGLRVAVFGSTGFLGRYVVNALARTGSLLSLPTRCSDADRQHLRVMGDLGQIVFWDAPHDLVRNEDAVRAAMRDCNAVVNLLGRDHETGHYGFRDVHVHGASLVARCAADAGAARLVHLSCMGASHGAASARLRAHAEGEAAVRAAFPGATILRPAPVFGPEDGLLNAWARAARALPVVPLIDGGAARLAPVEARDVAQAVAGALRADASAGATYHLAGPDEFTAAQLVALVFRTMRERPRVAAVPAWAARLAAAPRDLLQTLVPFPLPVPLGGMFTRSGVDEFAAGADYTLPVGAPCGLAALGVASPRRLAGLNIDYLRAYRAGGYDFGHTAGEEEEEEGAAAPAPAGSAAAAAARGRLPS